MEVFRPARQIEPSRSARRRGSSPRVAQGRMSPIPGSVEPRHGSSGGIMGVHRQDPIAIAPNKRRNSANFGAGVTRRLCKSCTRTPVLPLAAPSRRSAYLRDAGGGARLSGLSPSRGACALEPFGDEGLMHALVAAGQNAVASGWVGLLGLTPSRKHHVVCSRFLRHGWRICFLCSR